MSPKANVIVYSKPGCHLCEEAKAAIMSSGCTDWFVLQEVNIETDPELNSRYQFDIPVITIEGVVRFIHRVDTKEFCEEVRRIFTAHKW